MSEDNKQWEVEAVVLQNATTTTKVPTVRLIDAFLDDGWEPFAATAASSPTDGVVWLRRRCPKKAKKQ